MYPEYECFPSQKTAYSGTSPAIMESIDNPSLILNAHHSSTIDRNGHVSDVISRLECSKLDVDNVNLLESASTPYKSVLLINEKEHLKVILLIIIARLSSDASVLLFIFVNSFPYPKISSNV